MCNVEYVNLMADDKQVCLEARGLNVTHLNVASILRAHKFETRLNCNVQVA